MGDHDYAARPPPLDVNANHHHAQQQVRRHVFARLANDIEVADARRRIQPNNAVGIIANQQQQPAQPANNGRIVIANQQQQLAQPANNGRIVMIDGVLAVLPPDILDEPAPVPVNPDAIANQRRQNNADRQRAYDQLPEQAAARRRRRNNANQQQNPNRRLLNAARALLWRVVGLPERHYIGEFNVQCPICNATKFVDEVLNCCLEGMVRLPAPDQPFPDALRELFTSNSAEAKNFRKLIRVYNNLFSFVSMKLNKLL